jgi:hypothetical protein
MLSYLEQIDDTTLKWLDTTLVAQPDISRTQLAGKFCEHLSWQNHNGQPRTAASLIALRRLENLGLITLPKGREIACNDPARRGQIKPYPARSELHCSLAELGEIELIMVNGDRNQWQLWQSMVNTWHPLQNSNLCGARICYLIRCQAEGIIGAISFSSAAWRLQARDKWIGWTSQTRAENLAMVVNNSRFLILPQVHVPHLASHVLARACRQVAGDWEIMYGIRPVLLETFVDSRQYRGTCYRAAGWQCIGKTSGRGRQDTGDATQAKDIYCLPVQKNFRTLLGGQTPRSLSWTEKEFGQVNLGDKRLKKRLFRIAEDFYANPLASIPQACGSRSAAKAAYRFFQHPAVKLEETLSGHYQATAKRIQAHKGVILAAQDTTSLNYATHPSTVGLGPIDANGTQGVLVHDTMAFSEAGVPLGLIDVQHWVRQEKKNRTVAESIKWLESFKATQQLSRECPGSLIVNVGDREADFFDLFSAVQPDGAQLLVRAVHYRALADSDVNIWVHMQRCTSSGTLEVHIPPRKKQSARGASLSVTFDRVVLQPPKGRKELSPVTMWAVLARETDPPDGVEPLEWLLLTSVAVDNFTAACQRIEWYTRRWGIEVFHRTLKSGCKVEDRQLETVDRITACLAIDMVIAWRVYYLTMLGRQTPDVPCSVFFEEAEWKALTAHAARRPSPAPEPPPLYEAIVMVARLGGYIKQSRKEPPGTETIWRGLVALGWITDAWRAFGQQNGPPRKPG